MLKTHPSMADGEHSRPWRLRAGAYLGEISALYFLPLPPHLSPLPLLVAGSGSQLLVYDVKSGTLLHTFEAFQGIRVHGITLCPTDAPDPSSSPAAADFSIAVFGERRVKLFQLRIDAGLLVALELFRRLPGFDHWVLDVRFLKEDGVVAVGLSDNSVALYDTSRSLVAVRVRSPERCLLYSMRMLGDSVEALRVASGTIYNEIIIWKLSSQSLLSSSLESAINSTSGSKDIQLHDLHYVAVSLSRLTGHEGSIFRIAWSSDGTKLMSCSDDRSARIWIIRAQTQFLGESEEILDHGVSADLTLFGHNARIWDCYISDSVVITAGEDCTCRVWGVNGNQILMIKEHIGRGIWRCLYDPSSSLLITAGFDSAIKVHQLYSSLFTETMESHGTLNDLKDEKVIFTISAPKVSQQLGLMDSKSEYIRCLRFKRENILYVATNNGYLHQVELSNPEDTHWTELARVSKEAPIVCMDLLISSEFPLDVEDMVAVGDGKGNVTVVGIVNYNRIPKLALSFTWSAEKERQLLGIYWCKSLGCGHIFTADPRGILKLWRIRDAFLSDPDSTNMDSSVSLLAVFQSCFGLRIMCLDASIRDEILICGDQRGNITIFSLSNCLIASDSNKLVEEIPQLSHFKGAHGISSVTSILITAPVLEHIEIQTTGGDGCICYFKYEKYLLRLEFVGMKQLKELSTIQSVFVNSTAVEDLAHGTYAIGFTSADFIVWDLLNEIKMLQIPCGGWRRAYSYFLGAVPEFQNCFAYLKDHNIHVHRLWMSAQDRQLLPQALHMQYHGREIHSLCIMSFGLQSVSNSNCYLWTATGCEDGTVRLTRYMLTGAGSWCNSKLLGEHVGGSAVRSVSFVSKIYTTRAGLCCGADGMYTCSILSESRDDPVLLISVGAKQVLTSWLLQYRAADFHTPSKGTLMESENMFSSCMNQFSSISFQWLSTHMPPKFASSHRKVENLLESAENKNEASKNPSSVIESGIPECKKPKPKFCLTDKNENDWRYLAVTAFLVRHTDSVITVCFIVVACSDATLSLRALLLPYRLWFDVALLVPQRSPVLSLQHIVVPVFAHSTDAVHIGNAYIVISGSTDGSITFWDLTETVEYFMQLVSDLQPEKSIDCQKRPKTGRGSQGGRSWRSLTNEYTEGKVLDSLSKIEGGDSIIANGDTFASRPSSSEGTESLNNEKRSQTINSKTMPGMHSDVSSDKHELHPLHVVNSVHQSGVNCLHVSNIKDDLHAESKTAFSVVSGGDDQAVHCLVIDLTVQLTDPDSSHRQPTDTTGQLQDKMIVHSSEPNLSKKRPHHFFNSKLKVLNQDRISSAHSSAVKGVWTDGFWAFSTGLDQRVRCWKVGCFGKLTEYSHLIISVPEPETMDCMPYGSLKNRYQIAVAGRGMQMVEFSAP